MSSQRSARRRFGLLGAVLGVAAAGVAVGAAAERALLPRQHRGTADPYTEEPFGQLSYDESLTLTAPDGTDVYAEIVEPADGIALEDDFGAIPSSGSTPDPTLVFVHGFCLDMGTFHFQRKELTRRGDWRAVYYDQPGHGRSGSLSTGEYALSALGDALRSLIDETVPAPCPRPERRSAKRAEVEAADKAEGPVVLVGHSMGGMTIMAFAERYPAFFAQRVAGVILIASSAGRLEASALAVPELISRVGRPLLPLLNGATRLTGGVIDRARRASGDLAWQLTRRYGFGSQNPSPSLVSYVEKMNTQTPTETVARYLRTLYRHAGYPALEALRAKPVLLICGDHDPITPLAESEEMKQRLAAADLVVVPNGGHMVLMEHADAVNQAMLEFLEKLD
jgi:pimeloyl-ACP methyl ester carboxylesterase